MDYLKLNLEEVSHPNFALFSRMSSSRDRTLPEEV